MLSLPTQHYLEQLSYLRPLVSEAKNAITEYCLEKFGYDSSYKLKQRFAKFLIKVGDYKEALEITNIGQEQIRQLTQRNIPYAGDGAEEFNEHYYNEQYYLLYRAYKRAKYGDIESAKIILNQLQNEPIQENLREYFVRLYATLGQFDEAKKIYLECSSDICVLKYRPITYIAIAIARSGDLEGARNELADLKREMHLQLNRAEGNAEITLKFLVNAQIKIQDFDDALETIKQFPIISRFTKEFQDELFLKLGEAQFKAGKISDAHKTAELITYRHFQDMLTYVLENKRTITQYWKITDYWCDCRKFSLAKVDYKLWHEKLQNFANNKKNLNVLLKNGRIKHLVLEREEELVLKNNIKVKHIAIKIFASAQIQEGKIEDAIAAIHHINTFEGRASVLVELLEEYFEFHSTKFIRVKRAIL